MDAENPVNTSSPPKETTEMEVEHAVNTTTEAPTEDTAVEEPMEESTTVEEAIPMEESTATEAPSHTEEPTPMEEISEKDQEPANNTAAHVTATTTEAAPEVKQEMKEEAQPMEEVESSSKEPPPFLSAPASWQIPVAALHQQQQQQQQQQHSPAPQKPAEAVVNKSNVRKERSEARIAENKYDLDAWTSLINDAQQTGDLEAIREVYERVLKVFPTSPKHWLAYLELELKYSNFNEVEALFTRCLKTVLSVDLWKFYLGYIRRINLGESGSAVTPEARAIIEKAYEYVLSNVGIDKDAGPIWADYIYFLKSAETSNTWEEQRKMDSMRRAYQKAVTIPLNNVEHLWKEYDQWENNLNRLTAKKFLGEKSSAYMTARTALREMRLFTDNINTNIVSVPPQWTAQELNQLELWKNYIHWEKGDPLQLEDETAVSERVAYTYQQAFLVLRFYPEIWYSFASYYQELNKPEKALSILKQGIEILPASLLLNFSYAESCESRRQLDDARQAYDSLLETLEKDINSIKEAGNAEIAKLHKEAEEEKASMNLSDDIDGELREQLRSREKHVKKEQDAIEKKMNEQVEVIARSGSLVWISYMRFARRTDGIKSARALFSRARKAANCTYHVYVADALMEYHNSKDANVAGKVFSLGQKTFSDNPNFVCQYLDFLIQMNDDNNTRALFERTLATMPAEKAGPIWLKFLDYENKYGDLASVQSVEKRRIEAMANTSVNTMESFLIRQSYLDIQNIQEEELGSLARQQLLMDQNNAAVNAGPHGAQNVNAELTQIQPPPQLQQAQQQAQQQQQHHHHGKDNQKRPLLEPVHPERYPRPDLNQWQSFKPSAEVNRRVPVASSPALPNSPLVNVKSEVNEPIQQQPPIIPPPVSNNYIPPTQPLQQQPPLPPQPQQQQQLPLPDAVAYFVSNLPPPHAFNGPIIQPGDLVDLLRNISIPLPPQGAPGAPPLPPQPVRPQINNNNNKPPMQSGNNNNMRGQYGGNNNNRGGGRSGGNSGNFNKRGNMPMRGGKSNMKRNRGGRDDYEDDYQPHKGMGPNRPPDFDLFRQRQAKRHRDEPPY